MKHAQLWGKDVYPVITAFYLRCFINIAKKLQNRKKIPAGFFGTYGSYHQQVQYICSQNYNISLKM